MKILIVEGLDPRQPTMGGIEGYTRNLMEYLIKLGVCVTFIGVHERNPCNVVEGYKFISVAPRDQLTGYKFFLNLMIKVPLLQIPKSAIIHVQRPEYLTPFILFHSTHPKIVTLHGRMLESIRLKTSKRVRFIYEIIEPWALKHSDAIIAVDESTKDYYLHIYPNLVDKMKVLFVGIDLNKFKLLDRNALRKKFGFETNDKIVIYLGRLEKEKNLDFLVNCFSMLLSSVPESLLLFVGDGRERAHLEEIVRINKISRIVFMGAQDPDIVPEILNCVDVIALCSLFEGSPTVIKEALACGVPVVSTDIGDVSKVIGEKTIGRIADMNEESFTRALFDTLQTRDRERLRVDCSVAAGNFGFNRVGNRTVTLYNDLLIKKGRKTEREEKGTL